jgi:uncharacterized protein
MKPNLLFAGIVFLCCSPAAADQTKPDTIAVMGEAEVLLAPDFAKIEVGVITQGPVVADALAINNEKMSHVVEALRGLNIPDKDIQTASFNITPKYEKAASGDYDSSEMRAIVGYYITNKVVLTVYDLSKVAKIVDASVQAGANMGGEVSFQVKNVGQHMDDARRAAVANAYHKASVLTEAAHMRLGRALSITDNQANSEYNGRAGANVEMVIVTAERRETPILPGLITLTSQVTVVFQTKQ